MDANRFADRCLLGIELCLCVTLAGLFGAAYPDRFRTALWEAGGAAGWNSDPRQRIYFYANYKEPPVVPLIWSQRLTDSNLAVALLSLAMVLARITMRTAGQLRPTFAAIYDAILSLVWTHSVISQMSADMSDPKHPSPHPWYVTRGCGAARGEVAGACHVSQASFAVSLLVMLLYLSRLAVVAVHGVGALMRKWQERHDYQFLTVNVEDVDGHDKDEEARMKRERERYLYHEALSPVLAFFPEDSR
ncbi:hypothetical protein F5X68DRAFT_50626 [Plectosphaerella plurivora]|uniref:Uncharacterized protein n=1 Tax=Plectosphaerella plurivora TaxID=936078 RepID=A0A9P8V3B2_9PEZI|nr:hypothetical protein F5X68DRAFT_50626 [Plectosphaerella plurivora]